jgi:GT2 family glycosyltransferase
MTTRVVVDGKHLRLGGEPFRIKGVTYGSFVPRLDGEPFPERARMKEDLRAIADAGLNTVRTYELPPIDVLDVADELGLQVLVGLHYDDWRMEASPTGAARRRIRDAGQRAVEKAIERCAGRDHVLGIAVGNEIPADVVRVHGINAVQDALSELIEQVHAGYPDTLATYVNFPTTEYLTVEGQDFIAFNVFLEDPGDLRRYLRHLQVVSGPRPLVITELGMASEIHGEAAQACSIREQLRVVDKTGCAGATVFAWTDEWGVAGEQVDGWGFGITTADRAPKPALATVGDWGRSTVVDLRTHWPRVSVVVCAYNEAATIGECLRSLEECTYPDLEVIVCDDGSTDATLEIAQRFPFRVLELEHGGLSRGRNAGLAAATGDVVAYLDADAACHPEWPFHLVLSMEDDGVVATGGPNLGFKSAGFVERAVALSPGSPAEVLTADDRAEHVPGCNMAYLKHALEAIGGFDAAFTAAGDDVDVCWKLLERGEQIAFAPAAQVWHHRRRTARGYLRQQRGYGRAERMLTGAHPHRFNRLGQARWQGFIYGGAAILPSILRPVVYHGYAGSAPFQPVARRRAEAANMWVGALAPFALPLAALGIVLGVLLSPWWLGVPALVVGGLAAYGASVAAATRPDRNESHPIGLRLLVGLLHVLQPFARAWGRLRGRPIHAESTVHPTWSGDRYDWLNALEVDFRARGCHVAVGSHSKPWDLRITVGPLVAATITTATMWRWEPRYRVAYRPRPVVVVSLVVGIFFAVLSLPLGLLLTLGLVGIALVEAAVLRHRVLRALAFTTRGAKA